MVLFAAGEFAITTEIPTKKGKAEIEIHPVTMEDKLFRASYLLIPFVANLNS